MKNLKNFPNPVLINGNLDYKDSEFNLNLNEDLIDGDYVKLNLSYELECPGLQNIISDSKANAIIKLQSGGTPYREIFQFDKTKNVIEIKIPKNNLAKKIMVEGYIIAAENIKEFNLSEQNPAFFKSQSFDIRKGDVLAYCPGYSIPLDSREMEGPVASIFEIQVKRNMKEAINPCFDTENEKIKILLNEETYNSYNKLKSQTKAFNKYLAAVVVMPVLVEALAYIKGNEQQNSTSEYGYSEKRWFRLIKRKIEEKQINFEDLSLTNVANQLLKDIVNTALVSFKDALESFADGSNENGSVD